MDYETDVVYLTDETSVVASCSKVHPGMVPALRGPPLADIEDLSVQQALVTKDLLFALLGYEGFYIRFNEKYNMENIDCRLAGPDFKTAKHFDISLKSITRKLLRFGKYYSSLVAFVEFYDNHKFGKVVQRLCQQISEFIEGYQQVIVEFETMFNTQSNFDLNVVENMLSQKVANHISHLYDICATIHATSYDRAHLNEQGNTAQDFEEFMGDIRQSLAATGEVDVIISSQRFGYCKGSIVLKIIQQRINTYKGDAQSFEYLTHLFDSISEDYVLMLNNWLINGEIDDPFDEFIIKEQEVGPAISDHFIKTKETYWSELFVIRTDGLIEQFANSEIQLKILNTGKFLNVFKQCTGLHNFQEVDAHRLEPIESLVSEDLELKIDLFHKRANHLFLRLLFVGYQFGQLIGELQDKFMLKDCFPIERFFDQCFGDLIKNKSQVSVSSLSSHYLAQFASHQGTSPAVTWQAPRITVADIVDRNQQFGLSEYNFYDAMQDMSSIQAFDTDEILREDHTMDQFMSFALSKNNMLPPRSAGQTQGYDKYSLDDYAIASVDLKIPLPFPYNFLINDNLQYQYELVFKLLMIVHFLNRFNQRTWKDLHQSSMWTYQGFSPPIRNLIKRCRVLNSNLGLFLSELTNYFCNDVIDANYHNLSSAVATVRSKAQAEPVEGDEYRSRPSSAADSRFKHQSLGNFKSTNSVFDNMIQNQKPYRRFSDDVPATVEVLQHELTRYLGTVLNDAFLSRPDIMKVLHELFNVINAVNHYIAELKRKVVSCDATLLEQMKADKKGNFDGDIDMSDEAIKNRYHDMSSNLNQFMTKFTMLMGDFVYQLRVIGELESKSGLMLGERLEAVFGGVRE